MTWQADEILKAYLSRALDRRTADGVGVTEEDLRAAARELGVSDEELAAAEGEARLRLERGRGFLEFGRLDDAIRDLTEAAALRPLEVETVSTLAHAHLARWQKNGHTADRVMAERLARFCLDRDPRHAPSFTLLNALDDGRKQSSRRRMLGVAAGVLVGAGVAAGVLWQRPPVVVPPSVPVTQPAKVSTEKQVFAQAHATVPAALVPNAHSQGLALTLHRSSLDNYPERSFFRLEGSFPNGRDEELKQLGVQVDLLDAQGNVVQVVTRKPVTTLMDAPRRPGDVVRLAVIAQTRATVTEARVTLTESAWGPAPREYPPSPPVALEWVVAQPRGVELQVRQRSADVTPDSQRGGGYLTLVLEVASPTEGTLKDVRLQLLSQDAAGATLATSTMYVAGGTEPPLRGKEVAVKKHTLRVPQGHTRHVVQVLQVE